MQVERCDFIRGDLVDDHFLIDKILGEGSFGKVYRVSESGKVYALKLLKLWEIPSDVRQPLLDRFDMEFQTGQIESNYLVHSLRHGSIGGNPYILMEYCPEGDLGSRMENGRVDYVSVCRDVLNGLTALHSHGKVHRDLKPENVLFKSKDNAALTDFGISGDRNKRMTERNILGRPQQIFGTYAYMPPEQVSRARGDATVLPTTDIFSFGVMLYQMLTGGNLPFGPLNDNNDLVYYQMNGKNGKWDRNPIKRMGGEINWLAILEGCLEPDFKNRTQSAADVLKYLPSSNQANPEPIYSQPHTGRMLLRVMQGEEYGRTYPLADIAERIGMVITVGRGSDNNVCLI